MEEGGTPHREEPHSYPVLVLSPEIIMYIQSALNELNRSYLLIYACVCVRVCMCVCKVGTEGRGEQEFEKE